MNSENRKIFLAGTHFHVTGRMVFTRLPFVFPCSALHTHASTEGPTLPNIKRTTKINAVTDVRRTKNKIQRFKHDSRVYVSDRSKETDSSVVLRTRKSFKFLSGIWGSYMSLNRFLGLLPSSWSARTWSLRVVGSSYWCPFSSSKSRGCLVSKLVFECEDRGDSNRTSHESTA